MESKTFHPAPIESVRIAGISWWPALTLVACVWAAVLVWAGWDRSTELRDIRTDVSRLAFALGEHVEGILTEADRLSSLIGGAVVEHGVELPLAQWLNLGDSASSPFLQVSILDASGVIRSSTNLSFGAANLSDREHFRIHANRTTPTLFVSRPMIGRLTGRWTVQLSKGVVTPSGRFLGVVVVALDPLFLTNVYKGVYLGRQGEIGLIGAGDFIVRARWNGKDNEPGQVLPSSSKVREAISSSKSIVADKNQVDGIERVYGIEPLRDRDLVVLVGYSMDEALSNFYARLRVMISIACAISGLILVFQVRQMRVMRSLVALADREVAAKDILAEKKRQLRALFLAMPDGVAMFGRGRVIEEANSALSEMLGMPLEKLEGTTSEEFVRLLYRERPPSRDGCSVATLLAELNRAFASSAFVALVEFDLPVSPAYEIHLVQAADNSGIVLVLRDVTRQVRHDRLKSEFVSMAAHELRTPTASIAGYADLLAADIVPQQGRGELYKGIRSRAEHLNLLVSDLLDLARIEMHSNGGIELERVDMGQLVRDTVAREFPDSTRLLLKVGKEAQPVLADERQFSRAIRNLIENALKYSGVETEVIITVEKPSNEDVVRLCIIDGGIGMTREEAGMAFEKFYRANRHTGPQGSGLGLSIVREIVALHHGQIHLQTEIGQGTTVVLSLPALA